jgi:hypothetical protein
MEWVEMSKMLVDMDNKVYIFSDAQYRVIPPVGQRARQLELVAGEKLMPAEEIDQPADCPPTAEELPQSEPRLDIGPCPHCGAVRRSDPCEYCGMM